MATGTSFAPGDDVSSIEDALKGSEKRSFFATPLEPLFNNVSTGLCPELIRKSLQGLAKLNKKIEDHHDIELQNCFRTKNATTFFFLTCRFLKLPIDIQYRAIDLFIKFMTKHVMELYTHVQSTRNSSSPIEWETVQDRLTYQVTLRAITCIQLASKMSLHYKIVGVEEARSFLLHCGFRYQANSLVQSEIRVLKTLDFRVHAPTLLDYVEVILETLGYNNACVNVKQLHGISLKILNVFYLCYQDIFEKLKLNKNSSENVIVDLLLISSAIVGAAAFVLDQKTSDDLVKAVSDITCIKLDDILDFVAVLIEKIITS